MNIFFYDYEPHKNIQQYFDPHVKKMIIEYAQMMATAIRVTENSGSGGRLFHPSKKIWIENYPLILDEERESGLTTTMLASHKNHPCNLWVRESKQNYEYIFNLYKILRDEYEHRFGKTHAAWSKYYKRLSKMPDLPDSGLTKFPNCVHDDFKNIPNHLTAYRKFIKYGKDPKNHVWTKREKPYWWDKI